MGFSSPDPEGAQLFCNHFVVCEKACMLAGWPPVFISGMIKFMARQLSITSVTEINSTTELALFWRWVTILDFIYIYALTHKSIETQIGGECLPQYLSFKVHMNLYSWACLCSLLIRYFFFFSSSDFLCFINFWSFFCHVGLIRRVSSIFLASFSNLLSGGKKKQKHNMSV